MRRVIGTIPRRARAAAMLLALVSLVPVPSHAAPVTRYAEATMDGWVKTKGYSVSAEGVHRDFGDQPAVPEAPGAGSSTIVLGESEVCVVADSGVVTKGKVRTAVREQACPGRGAGFHYDSSTFEASIVGKVTTSLWSRRWEVIGGRWALVKDTTVAKKAIVDLTWRWSQTPDWGFRVCGSGFDSAFGVGGPAVASGTIVFKGAGFTARIPSGTPGTLFIGVCGDAP